MLQLEQSGCDHPPALSSFFSAPAGLVAQAWPRHRPSSAVQPLSRSCNLSSANSGPSTVPQALSSLFPAPATSSQQTAAPAPSLKLCQPLSRPCNLSSANSGSSTVPQALSSLSPAPATSPQAPALLSQARPLTLCPASLPLSPALFLKPNLFSAKHCPRRQTKRDQGERERGD